MNGTNPSEVVSIIERIGLPLAIILFIAYLGFKYFNMKIKLMEKEFDHKLRGRKYNIKGTLDVTNNKDTGRTIGNISGVLDETD